MNTREKTIGKNKYTLTLPPVRQAMPICTKVAVLAGPAIASLGTDVNKDGMQTFSMAIAVIDPEKLDALFIEAANISKLTCAGKMLLDDLAFSQHFSDCRGEVYPAMFWTLWECVRDFLPQAESFVQKVSTSIGKEFQSQMDGKATTG